MNKFHKLAMLLAGVALVFGLVACPNKTEPKPEPTPTPTPTPVVPTPGPEPSTEVKVTGVSLNMTKVYRENGYNLDY